MNLLDEIKSKALEVYGDEKQAQEFVEGFVKAASIWESMGEKDTLGASVIKGLGESAGRAVAGGAAAIAAHSIGSILGTIRDHSKYNKFLAALNEAVQNNRILKVADQSKVINFANTIYKFAPTVASDPNLLGHALANAIQGELMDTKTINDLVQLEERYKNINTFEPKKWL